MNARSVFTLAVAVSVAVGAVHAERPPNCPSEALITINNSSALSSAAMTITFKYERTPYVNQGFFRLPKDNQRAGILYHGKVYVIGGQKKDGNASKEVYTVTVDKPQEHDTVASLPKGLIYPATAVTMDGRMIVSGGAIDKTNKLTAAVYAYVDDLVGSETWSTIKPLPSARQYHTMTATARGVVLIGGNADSHANSTAIFYLRDSASVWEKLSDVDKRIARHAAVALGPMRVLVCGGEVDGKPTNACNILKVEKGKEKWTSAAPMAETRVGHQMVLINDVIYIFGGGAPEAEMYDVSSGGTKLNTIRFNEENFALAPFY